MPRHGEQLQRIVHIAKLLNRELNVRAIENASRRLIDRKIDCPARRSAFDVFRSCCVGRLSVKAPQPQDKIKRRGTNADTEK